MKNVVEGGHGAIGGDTLAEGIAVKEPGALTRQIIADKVDRIDLVAEKRHRTCGRAAGRHRKDRGRRGRGGRPRRAARQPGRYKGRKVGTVLCGGNIDTHLLANVLVRELVRCGRIARLSIAAQDRPGALAAITATFHECGVNIIEVKHQRIFTRLPAKDTVIEVECEARDSAGDRAAGRRARRRRDSTSSAPRSTDV